MRKSSLNGLPSARLPEGYSLRNFQHGDEVGWAGLVDGAIGSWDAQLARDRFLREEGVVASGIFFVMRDAEYVATATAKRRQEDAPYTGYLHMVAVASREARNRHWPFRFARRPSSAAGRRLPRSYSRHR
jgi:hypothetical protein